MKSLLFALFINIFLRRPDTVLALVLAHYTDCAIGPGNTDVTSGRQIIDDIPDYTTIDFGQFFEAGSIQTLLDQLCFFLFQFFGDSVCLLNFRETTAYSAELFLRALFENFFLNEKHKKRQTQRHQNSRFI